MTETNLPSPPSDASTNDDVVRLLLVDDHAILREGLAQLLGTRPDMNVVAQASDGEEAVLMALSNKPDVILMDVNMPKVNGYEATQAILTTWPAANILILTNQDDVEVVRQFNQTNIRGFLLKDVALDDLVSAIYSAKSGQRVPLASELTERMEAARKPAGMDTLADPLTERELDVLRSLAEGRNNADIADVLCVSPKTVHNHLYNIYSKLGVSSRAEAIVWALAHLPR